ncbi:winged helix-turn-helix domain-containing protein [Bordetella genomosp. 10]|nr:winged helix-turn-helix domain-containing protein [Bordetella genomosp. 10]
MVELTFLMLSDASSDAARDLLRLRDLAVASGLRARVSTNPLAFAETRPAGGVAVAVIDGLGASGYDVPWLVGVLRCLPRMAIIMLAPDTSAARSQALLAGADLCLSIPVDGAEFRAAVCAVTRRIAVQPGAPAALDEAIAFGPGAAALETGLAFRAAPADAAAMAPPAVAGEPSADEGMPAGARKPWRLVSRGWTLLSPQGHRIDLTATERGLLRHLFLAPRAIVSHQDLVNRNVAFTRPANEGRRTPLAGVVSRLKKKCREVGVSLPILSSRGRGYRFAEDCVIGE